MSVGSAYGNCFTEEKNQRSEMKPSASSHTAVKLKRSCLNPCILVWVRTLELFNLGIDSNPSPITSESYFSKPLTSPPYLPYL